MIRCRVCKALDRDGDCCLRWQPFGPERPRSRLAFVYAGWHYRGFAALPVCEACKTRILDGAEVVIRYRKVKHILPAGAQAWHVGEVSVIEVAR